jgi:DnaJ-domain-containing protein 1
MKKIKESHPDKLPANTPEWIIKVAQEKFSKLQEAYKAICEAKKQ